MRTNGNKIRRLLQEKSPSISTRLSSAWPLITEIVGVSGYFDYIEFLAEYAPYSLMDLENITRAAELHDMGSMIKVDFQNRGYVAQKAVGAGFQAVLFTDHRTADEVRESIRLLKPDTPEDGGFFGHPANRFQGAIGGVSQMSHAQRLRDTVLCFMIEKKQAMAEIEEICSIPGVDMVQFGPSDFSMSNGWNRSEHMEECLKEERRMIEVAIRHGVQPRCEIQSSSSAQYYVDLGVHHFSLGDQISKLREFYLFEGEKMRSIADALK